MRFIGTFFLAFVAAIFIWVRSAGWNWPVLVRIVAPPLVFAAISYLLLGNVGEAQWRNLGESITLMF